MIAAIISSYIKSMVPQSFISATNILSSKVDPILIDFYRLKTGWNKPIPPFDLRRITAKRSIDNYVKSGESIVKSLISGLSYSGKNLDEFDSILDFGCGAGRQIQYFYDSKPSNITGCDPNAEHIQWLSSKYPLANFYVSEFNPPLPFTDAQFDLIYSVSVFTHLSEKAQFSWLAELNRILRVGGVALLTIQGEHAARLTDKNKATLRDKNAPQQCYQTLSEQKFLFYVPDSYRPVNKFINPNSISDDDMYGITWHSQDYILSKWSQYFDVVKIIPSAIDSLQDLVVLQKK